MRKILCLAFVAGAACGGGSSSSKPTTPEPPPPPAEPSPCVAMSRHMRDMVVKAGEAEDAGADMLAKLAPIIERVTAERCQADAWSAEVITCVNAADDETMDPCIEQLTDEQEKALEDQIEQELAPVMEEEAAKAEQAGDE